MIVLMLLQAIQTLTKINEKFKFLRQKYLVLITFGELIPKDKTRKNDSKNMSVLQNDIHISSRYAKILMDSGASASIIHDSFVRTNKFNRRKT